MFFFYKQKSAFEMLISDCSSDVFSSDLFQFGLPPPDVFLISSSCACIASAWAFRNSISEPWSSTVGVVSCANAGRARQQKAAEASNAEVVLVNVMSETLFMVVWKYRGCPKQVG